MEDIAPKLYSDIIKEFERRTNSDGFIKSFREKIDNKTAKAEQVSVYARKLGECGSEALCKYLTEDNLPDGKLYWNIAERTIKPLAEEIHKLVNEAAVATQLIDDEKSGIGLKPRVPAFPEKRFNALINKVVNMSLTEEG